MKGKIIIVDDEPLTRVDLRDMLELENYEVVGEASDGFEAIELSRIHHPDLVIMDVQMPLLDGLNAGKKIMSEKLTHSILMLTAYSDVNHREKAMSFGASGYLVKPLDEKSFIPTVEMAINKGKKMRELECNMSQLSLKLEQRKTIEKAKGILMAKQSIDEATAYKQIRNLSMDKRCPMIDVAELLVMANDC